MEAQSNILIDEVGGSCCLCTCVEVQCERSAPSMTKYCYF